jgi:molecular chaperone GrpE
MADPKAKAAGDMETILPGVSEEELVDLDTLAAEEPDLDGEVAALKGEIEALKVERDDMHDRFMRALADAENARKRGDKDRREAEQYGGTRLARDLLPVYDNLTRALRATTEAGGDADKALLEGVELTLRELLNIFEKHGIKRIAPEAGERFDPQMHEAMFEAPVPGTKAGDIIEVMAQGFLLHDRLLRPAQVGVSSMPAS